jgi:hypothetical protein
MVRPALQQSNESSNVFDKYSFNTIVDGTKSQNDDEFKRSLLWGLVWYTADV